jgi:hypothetical protein
MRIAVLLAVGRGLADQSSSLGSQTTLHERFEKKNERKAFQFLAGCAAMSTKRKATADASDNHTAATKQQRSSDQPNSKKNGILLQRGMVLLRSHLSSEQQQALSQQVTLLGQSAGGFYDCNNEKTKRMRMVSIYSIQCMLCVLRAHKLST